MMVRKKSVLPIIGAVLALFWQFVTTESVVQQIPVRRHKVKNSARLRIEERIGRKRNSRNVSLAEAERAVITSEAVRSCYDVVYYGDVSLGDPQQKVQVILDTGSSDFWVASVSCGDDCAGLNLYDHTQSSSYQADGQSFRIEYADADTVSGHRSFETVHWAGARIENQGFAEIDTVGSFFICGAEDGLLGMAFSSISRLGVSTPFESMVKQNIIDAGVFAFGLPSANDNAPGVLTLGGVDKAHYVNEIEYVSLIVPPSGFWEVRVSQVFAGDSSLTIPTSSSRTAIIDTGTSLIVARPEAVHKVAIAFDAICYLNQDDIYSVQPCSSFSHNANYVFDIIVAPCNSQSAESKNKGLQFIFEDSQNSNQKVTVNIPRQYLLSGEECLDDEFRDCSGVCWSNAYLDWNYDEFCDDARYGINFNCPRFDCDNNACASCGPDATVPYCMLGMSAEYAIDYWLLGDTFLTSTYTVFDYDNTRLGFAPSNKDLTAPPTISSPPTPLEPDDDLSDQYFDTQAPSSQPTAKSLRNPTERPSYGPLICEDDINWHVTNSPTRDCDWVALNPTRRCVEMGQDNRIAERYCALACGNCQPSSLPTISSEPTFCPTTLAPSLIPSPSPTYLPSIVIQSSPTLQPTSYEPTQVDDASPPSGSNPSRNSGPSYAPTALELTYRPSVPAPSSTAPSNTRDTEPPTTITSVSAPTSVHFVVMGSILLSSFIDDKTRAAAAIAAAAQVPQYAVSVDLVNNRLDYIVFDDVYVAEAYLNLVSLTSAELDQHFADVGFLDVTTTEVIKPRIVSAASVVFEPFPTSSPTHEPTVSYFSASKDSSNGTKDSSSALVIGLIIACVLLSLLLLLMIGVVLWYRRKDTRISRFRALDASNVDANAADIDDEEVTDQTVSGYKAPSGLIGRSPYRSIAEDNFDGEGGEGMIVLNALHSSSDNDMGNQGGDAQPYEGGGETKHS